MARFHIETVTDPSSGMVFAEAYKDAGNVLVVRSEPIFKTHEDAEAAIVASLQQAWPDRFPEAVDASIGV